MPDPDSPRPVPRWVAERELPGRRLFVAVPVPAPIVADVAHLVEGVRAEVAETARRAGREHEREVRWVRMDGLHLTLRFLGPTLDDRLPVLASLVDEVASATAPFEVSIGGAGAFPGPARPRVIWLGVDGGADELGRLASTLGKGLATAGWPPEERPFSPHLSLARADGVHAGGATAAALAAAAAGFRRTWTADRLVLFESHTGGGRARYEPLREASFIA